MSEDSPPESKFNAAISKLQRIHMLRHQSQIYRLEHNLVGWFECLLAVRSELWQKMNDKERDKSEALCINLSNVCNDYISQVDVANNEGGSISSDFYTLLDSLERWLFDIEQKYGLSLPDKIRESMLDTE